MRVRGAHLLVHHDPAARTQRESRVTRQTDLGPDTQREDHEIGRQACAALRHDDETPVGIRLESQQAVAQVQLDALIGQVLRHRRRHLRIERRHNLRQLFDNRHGQLTAHEVLGHLEPDEAAAHYDRAPGPPLLDPRTDSPRVGNAPQREHAWKRHAGERRPDRRGAG